MTPAVSLPSLIFQAPLLRVRKGLGVGFTRVIQPMAPTVEKVAQPIPLARALALAHRLDKALDQGEAKNFHALALRLGVTKARLSMLLALLNLAPDIQEAILFREAKGAGEWIGLVSVLAIAREASWVQQRRRWADLLSVTGRA